METSKPTTTPNIYSKPEDIRYAFPMVGNVITKAPGVFGGQPEMQAVVQTGMTLRDYFASQALSSDVISATVIEFHHNLSENRSPNEADIEIKNFSSAVANMCYTVADAMLAERSKVKP